MAPLVGVGKGVEGYLGGVEDGVRNIGAEVILSKKLSNCFKESALCNVSSGLIDGTPPHPSIAKVKQIKFDKYALILWSLVSIK